MYRVGLDGDSDAFVLGGGNATGDENNDTGDRNATRDNANRDEGLDGAEAHGDGHVAGLEEGPRGGGNVSLAEKNAKSPAEAETEGDAGVDAWLISYNRRLKNELERLRGRTRKAEEK